MRIAITGGFGFLGWHTAARLHALHNVEATLLGREDLADPGTLAQRLRDIDAVIHIAGVNRAPSEDDIESGNVAAAQALVSALAAAGTKPHIVYANSIQAGSDSAYGRGKERAGAVLSDHAAAAGSAYTDVRLPNIFGEHGKPDYNSFVATFCHALATGAVPEVRVDRAVLLMHAQAAASLLIDAALAPTLGLVEPKGTVKQVTEVLSTLERFSASYGLGQVPALNDAFDVDLFNTFRSYFFPDAFPFHATVHADPRGELFETVRVLGGTGQTFISTTRPGQTRGDHYHLSKIERFFVVSGEAEIALRRVLDDQVVRFRLSGNEPAFVDMPTMWAHSITNVGDSDLITMFWADQLLNPDAPDTYWENVVPSEGGVA